MQIAPSWSLPVLILLALVAASCGDDGGGAGADADTSTGLDLTLTLMGYGMQEDGNTLYFALYDDADDWAPVATATKDIVSGGGGGGGGGGGNAVTFPEALESGQSYTLYWYSDRNANQTCEATSDQHWQLAIPAASDTVELSHQHDTSQSGDCSRH